MMYRALALVQPLVQALVRVLALALPFVLTGLCARADDAPPPVEAFFKPAVLSQPKLSPDGKRLAFMTSNTNGRTSIAVIDLADDKVHPLGVLDADVTNLFWVSSQRIVFEARDLRAAGLEGQRHRRTAGLFSVLVDGSEFRRLIHDELADNGDAGHDTLGWNHMLLEVPSAQAAAGADTVIIGRLRFEGSELASVIPMWLNVRTGAHRNLDVGEAPPGAFAWWFDSAGNARAVLAKTKDTAAYFWRAPGQTGWLKLVQGDRRKLPMDVQGVDDLGRLYVSTDSGPGHTEQLARWDFASHAPETGPLVSVTGFDFEGSLLQGAGGAGLLGVRVIGDGETTAWFNPTMRQLQAELDRALPGHINRIDCQRCGQPDMVASVLSLSDRDPGSLYVFDAASKRLRHLQAAREEIDPQQMAAVDFKRIKARDGRDLPVWVTLPARFKAGQPLPTIVMVHGGPWARGAYWRWDAMNQFLASRGYLVIEPEFRGSAGYGQDHLRAGRKQWGQAMEDDLADALQWAVDKGLAAKGRACIMGASYGGYAALMGPVRQPEKYRCVVATSAVTDLELFVQGSWFVHDDISDISRELHLPEWVGDADAEADRAMLRANSPVLLARQMHAPVLLAWGGQDLRVPLTHGERMRKVLSESGNPPQWILYPNEGHGWANSANEIDFARQVEAFLAKNLQ